MKYTGIFATEAEVDEVICPGCEQHVDECDAINYGGDDDLSF